MGAKLEDYRVASVTRAETRPFIMDIHYARRMPSISYAYGLFRKGELVGVVTFGSPASPPLCVGVCGPEWKGSVLELNRLVLRDNIPNEASILVSGALKLLPRRPLIIVSYADTAMGHVGAVYQATNFLFTGTSKPRTDMAAKDGKHPRHHAGDRENRVPRSAKHRYVTFIGSRTQRRQLRRALRYPVLPFPKTSPAEVTTP